MYIVEAVRDVQSPSGRVRWGQYSVRRNDAAPSTTLV